MKQLNPAHITAIKELLADGPFYKFLGMHLSDIEPGYARLELTVEHHHLNPFGQIHGGVLASLFDTTTYWALYADMPEDRGYVTLDLSVNDLHSTHTGKIICETHLVHEANHVSLTEGTVKTEDGTLLATGISKLYSSPAIPPVNEMLKKLDPTITLPPKFIGR